MHNGDMSATRRISVTLESADQAVLDAFAAPDTGEHATLERWAAEHGVPVRDSSESAIMRMLARVGAAALREQALEQGYAKLAADASKDDRDERRARRARYTDRVDRRFAE